MTSGNLAAHNSAPASSSSRPITTSLNLLQVISDPSFFIPEYLTSLSQTHAEHRNKPHRRKSICQSQESYLGNQCTRHLDERCITTATNQKGKDERRRKDVQGQELGCRGRKSSCRRPCVLLCGETACGTTLSHRSISPVSSSPVA